MKNLKRKSCNTLSDFPQVCLVLMPYAPVERPSLALGILKSCLARYRISVQVLYENIEFFQRIGKNNYQRIINCFRDIPEGEWTFSSHISDKNLDEEGFLHLLRKKKEMLSQNSIDEYIDELQELKEKTLAYIEEAVHKIIQKSPKIVGCSSSFQQNCPSLALLKAIKEKCPDIVTMMGGANCEQEMGLALLQGFSYVDYVISGEPEDYFGEFCQKVIEKNNILNEEEIPSGVLAQKFQNNYRVSNIPRSFVNTLDSVPIPDYSEYFSVSGQLLDTENMTVGLPVETSRGCFWGAKNQCTFCGLNGAARIYRTKASDRVLNEIIELAERYGVKNIECVDNVINPTYIESVFSKIKNRNYSVFCEVRSTLSKEQIYALADSGVQWVQPGIESLHDDVLKIMNKGVSALQNIAFLKFAREAGIRVSWNMLAGFPGEDESWYHEIVALIPLLSHLQPSSGITQISIDRFNVYQTNPENYGLNIHPLKAYSYIYPVSEDIMHNLGYFFEAETDELFYYKEFKSSGKKALAAAVADWKKTFWSPHRELLSQYDTGITIEITDLRSCAVSFVHTLTGIDYYVMKCCETVQTVQQIEKSLLDSGLRFSLDKILESLAMLCAKKLVLRNNNHYLSLVLNGLPPGLNNVSEFPCGTFLD